MDNTRQTKQRTVVYGILKGTTAHPNAAVIYDQARLVMPNISLGTVYRNLRLLEKSGVIRKLVLSSGVEHFDADLRHHHHFVCEKCGRILDVGLDSDLPSLCELEKCCGLKPESGFVTKNAEVLFYGICPDCSKTTETDENDR